MKAIRITITRFTSNAQPGFVECRFYDAWGREHIVEDKVPIVTSQDLDENSVYPQDGIIACEIINEWKDKEGRRIFTVTTERPFAVETIDKLSGFDLVEEQLIEIIHS